MANYASIFDMTTNATYAKQITIACRVAAQNVINESVNTPNHVNRVVWANAALSGHALLLSTIGQGVSMNGTIQAAAPAGPWNDSDIQFVVNGLIDSNALSLFGTH